MTANAVPLGLSVSQVESANDAADDFAAKLLAAKNAKDAAKGAVSEKDKSRKTTTSTIRELAQIVKNAPGATPTILAACGLTPGSTPGGVLGPVADVSATASANGTAVIRFNRNGNSRNTTFLLQYRLSESGAWQWLGTTTRTRFVDGGAAPGVFKMYRVISQKAGVDSTPSNEAVIYGEGFFEDFSIAA